MKKYLLIFLLLNSAYAIGQTYTPYVSGDVDVCPGNERTYYLNNYDYECEITWDLTGCTLVSKASNRVTVNWDNVTGGGVTANTGGNNCSSEGQYSLGVTVHSVSTVIPNLFSDHGTGTVVIPCGTGTITFSTNPAGVGATYHWNYSPASFTGLTTTTVPSVILTYVNPGSSGGVTVNLVGSCGDTGPASNTIVVARTGPVVTISPSPDNGQICSGETMNFTATGGGAGFNWYSYYTTAIPSNGLFINGVAASTYTSSSPLHTTGNSVALTAPSGYGEFFILAKSDVCPEATYYNSGGAIQMGPLNNSQFSIAGDAVLCGGAVGTYNSTTIWIGFQDAVTSYVWGHSAGFVSASGQGTSSYAAAASGTFSGGSITLQLGNRCGAGGSPAVLNVTAKHGCSGGQAIHTISPNPASTTATINTSDLSQPKEEKAITLFQPQQAFIVDNSSTAVMSFQITSPNHTIDISHLKTGVYFLKVINDNQEVTTTRLLVNH